MLLNWPNSSAHTRCWRSIAVVSFASISKVAEQTARLFAFSFLSGAFPIQSIDLDRMQCNARRTTKHLAVGSGMTQDFTNNNSLAHRVKRFISIHHFAIANKGLHPLQPTLQA